MKKVIECKGSLIAVKQRQQEVTASGIILTKDSLEGGSLEEFEGEIVAVGDLVSKFKPGDNVCFGKNSFTIKKYFGKEYFFLYEHAINTTELLLEDDKKLLKSQFVIKEDYKEGDR